MKTKFKKVISLCLALIIACSMLTFAGFGTSAAENDFEYTIDEGKTYVTITGYTGTSKDVKIPSEIEGLPVRYIAEYAFLQNSNITTVEIPSSVKAIDRYAFFQCTSLSKLTLNEGLKYIGTSAFNDCTSLKTIVIPDTVLYIDDYAFYGDTSLKDISLGKRLAYIGENAIGWYTYDRQTGYDSETGFAFLDKSNEIVSNIKITGYSDTAAPSYVAPSKLSTSYTSLGASNVNAIGDLNGDGEINIKDATVIQKIVAEIIPAADYDFFVCDVDDDNAITGADTTAIQKYIVGYTVTLGGEAYDAPVNSENPDDYVLPTVRFYDTNEDRKNTYTMYDIYKFNSKSYESTQKIVLENFENLGETVECYANVKLQGSSSMSYEKKNFTIKLFKDAKESSKNKMKIVESWGKENKYCLKANYIDHTHARNIVSAQLWGDVVRSRKNVDKNIAGLVNCGAIDGFPIKVYINDQYQGLYTFNIPKDGWMMGMDSDDINQAILCGENHSGSSAFLSEFNTSDWSIEYATDEKDTAWINNSFNNFYYFLRFSSDADFKANISKYTDLEACIDYMLFIHIICGMDCWDKNMLFVTFDGGEHWFPSVYDLDTTFGIHWNGQSFYYPDEMDKIANRTPSLLWQRLLTVYPQEVMARYAELREGPLSLENIITRYENFRKDIPSGLYQLDIFGNNIAGGSYTIPQYDCSNINQAVTYMANRYKTMDSLYGYKAK